MHQLFARCTAGGGIVPFLSESVLQPTFDNNGSEQGHSADTRMEKFRQPTFSIDDSKARTSEEELINNCSNPLPADKINKFVF